jgi:hypothetical protein
MAHHVHALTEYRFFFVNDGGDAYSLKWILCADDAEACSIAETLAETGPKVEVWDVGRRVALTRH